MFVSTILGRADRIETLQNGIEISISFLLVLSCEVIPSIWMLQWIPKYFSVFKMDSFHLIISAISTPPSQSLCCYPPNLNGFGVCFNALIGFCCDSRYMWRTVIDWLLWFRHENPNSPVSTGDVTARTPGAEATECIAEACRNSAHTPQLCSVACCAPLVFVNDIKPDSTRSCVLNWDRLDFNDPIVPAPFIEDFGSSRYENNGLSKVQIFFLNGATRPGGKLKHPS